jgi:putative adhesin
MTDDTTTSRAGLIEHRIGATGFLQVNTSSGDIDVRGTDAETVRIMTQDPDEADVLDQYVVEAGDGSLHVRSPRGGLIEVNIGTFKWGRRLGGGGGTDLIVEVPHGARVEIGTVSGDLHASGLDGQQRYKTVSGDMELDDVQGMIDLDGTSGDVRLLAAGTVALDLRTVSGDIAARAGVVERLAAQTMSGDMRIEAALAPGQAHTIETVSGDTRLITGSGLTIEARTVSGDIRSDVPHRTGGEAGRRSIILGDGRAHLSFRSLSGDLQLTGKGPVLPANEGAAWRGELATPAPASPSAPTPPASAAIVAPASQPPTAPTPPAAPPAADPLEPARLEILRSLQVGDIDVATAGERLAALDDAASAFDEGGPR